MAKKSPATPKEYTFSDWCRSLHTGGTVKGGICFIVALLFIMLFGRAVSQQIDDKIAYEQQAAVVELFDVNGSPRAQAAQRRELARSILTVKSYGNGIEEFKYSTVEKQVRAIAQTGEPLKLHPIKPSFLDKFLHILLICLCALAVLASLAIGLLHCAASYDEKVLIIDMPWRRLWAWVLPLCAPWLLPFLFASLCRALWWNRQEIRKALREKLRKKPKEMEQETTK